MEIGIVGLKDHRSPTTVGYIDVAPVLAQSTNGTSKAWGINIEKKKPQRILRAPK